MSRKKNDKLLLLINSLTPSEKRSFKLYVNRNKGSKEKLFVQLFDILDKMESYEEDKIFKKIPALKKSQLSNVKSNLYTQILTCLRQLYRHQMSEIGIREQQDFAKVLYSKGLYKSSLEMLDKSRKNATQNHKHFLLLDSIMFEKKIESQHVTGSMYPKADQLSSYTTDLMNELTVMNKLSNLSLLMYGLYLKRGVAKNAQDKDMINTFFENNKPEIHNNKLGFYQKLYLYQSYVWYTVMIHDFAGYFKFAKKWVELFTEYPLMIKPETTSFIKANHNVLNALFLADKNDKFLQQLKVFENIETQIKAPLSRNEQAFFETFLNIHQINSIFVIANYKESNPNFEHVVNLLETNTDKWDVHRTIVFYYKIACVYFGKGELEKCIEYLNKISNESYPEFKEDIQCFARILNLVAQYELGNQELVFYQVKNVYRFLMKMKDINMFQKEILSFIRRTPKMNKETIKQEFIDLKTRLLEIKKLPYEQRPFLYFDIISWLDSKIDGIDMVTAIKRNKGLGNV